MGRWLLLGMALAVLDLYLLYRIGAVWGLWTMLAVLFLPTFLGGGLVRTQRKRCWEHIQEEIEKGRVPAQKMVEGGVILCAGLLLMYPGPASTGLGLFLLIPGIRRAMARRWLKRFEGSLVSAPTTLPGTPGSGAVFIRASSEEGAARMPKGLKAVEGKDLGSQPLHAPSGGELPEPGPRSPAP